MTRTRIRFAAAALLCVIAGYLPIQAARADTSGTVFLQTVPAMAGVQLVVGGIGTTTDSSGRATVHVPSINGVADTVRVGVAALGDGTRIGLGRVAILPHVAHQSRLAVGLNVWARTRLDLRPGTTGVTIGQVDSVRLRSMTGIVKLVHPRSGPAVELLARRPQLVHNVLIAQPVTWSVASIDAGPGVALTSAAARFDPYGKSTWPLELSPVEGTVRVSTVPATAGVQFIIDGASTVTGANGIAEAQVSDLNDLETRLSLGSRDAAGGQEVSLLRVRKMPPRAVHERELVAGLAVRRPVLLRFTDLNGAKVPATRVSGVGVQADQTLSHFDAAQVRAPIMLLSAKATLVHNAWRVHRLVYAMTSATIDGGQAVFAGQQRFTPASASRWNVKLSVFSVHITAHDALLGTRVSSRLVVTRPDRSTYATAVPSSGRGAVMTSVVRGDYDLHFSAAVLGATTSLRISRSDSFDVRIVTPIDVALVGAVVVLLAGSALLAAVRVARRREEDSP